MSYTTRLAASAAAAAATKSTHAYKPELHIQPKKEFCIKALWQYTNLYITAAQAENVVQRADNGGLGMTVMQDGVFLRGWVADGCIKTELLFCEQQSTVFLVF